MIYTLPANMPVDLVLDNKPIRMVFTADMKVVHPSILVRNEKMLMQETQKKIINEKQRNAGIGILSSILAVVVFIITKKKGNHNGDNTMVRK
jgi:hypothetical protein